MANVAGVDLPSNKQVAYSLRYIYGIGQTRAGTICKEVGIDPIRRTSSLTEDELSKIRSFIDKQYKVETDLKHEVTSNIREKISIRCYQGLRHQAHLPVRGQRTHDNAKTRKKGKSA